MSLSLLSVLMTCYLSRQAIGFFTLAAVQAIGASKGREVVQSMIILVMFAFAFLGCPILAWKIYHCRQCNPEGRIPLGRRRQSQVIINIHRDALQYHYRERSDSDQCSD
jgi:hypothetical protein